MMRTDGEMVVAKWEAGIGRYTGTIYPEDRAELVRLVDAALAQARAAILPHVRFTEAMIERTQEMDFAVDGADVQELALAAGVLVATTYDPAVHGEQADADPGDEWLVLSEAYRAVRAESLAAGGGA